MVTPQIIIGEQPPLPENVNTIELISLENSKIQGVSVYSGRAEVTRLFKFKVKTGQNLVVVNGLPNVLDNESLRVEGRGAATIHDVTVSYSPPPASPSSSPALQELLGKRARMTKALERCKKSIASVESYLATLNVQHIEVGQVGKVVKEYDATAEELDNRQLELEGQIKELDVEINTERTKLLGPKRNNLLNTQAKIGVFADVEGEVEIALIYAVHGATWNASYDIRVDMSTKEDPVNLIYKALITQSTGEDWTDIPLTLETATPTFGVGVPVLEPWQLSVYKAPKPHLAIPPPPPILQAASPMTSRLARSGAGTRDSSSDLLYFDGERERERERAVVHRQLDVASKGNVSATFLVPGLITIPSDGAAHNVTIVQLLLSAVMSWVCVPKKDTKTHLSAKIKNASQYTLLRGTGSVYVDGSFISRSQVPSVSPDESFHCALGLDPSIRITYHPLSKKKTESGFYLNRTATHIFTQNISIHNTKSIPAVGVRVLEQIPVSEDSQIQVHLISPELATVSAKDDGWEKPMPLGTGITALWEGADEPEPDLETLGKSGKLNWVCTVPPQTKVNLVLQWEVLAPARTEVVGLDY